MRVAVTSSEPEELAALLRERGLDVVTCPLVAVEPLGDAPIDVEGYDWVVVTSRHGASELRRRMRGRPARVAAIGHATAEVFGAVDLVPSVSTQEGLLAELPRPAGRVLFAGAEGARRLLVDELGAEFVPLYRTRELRPEAFPAVDLVVLQSGSAARALPVELPVVTMGPETTRAARERGLAVVAEAETHDLEGLAAAVASAAWSSPS